MLLLYVEDKNSYEVNTKNLYIKPNLSNFDWNRLLATRCLFDIILTQISQTAETAEISKQRSFVSKNDQTCRQKRNMRHTALRQGRVRTS